MRQAMLIAMLLSALLVMAGCAGTGPSAASSTSSTSSASAASASASASASAQAAVLENCPVSRDENFGHINIEISIDDFDDLGFTYGDGVSIEFSNGYKIDVPYFNGYYDKVGKKMLVAYPGYQHPLLAENCGDPMWQQTGLSEGDTATVTLTGPRAYSDVQESFDIEYSDNRDDFSSDEAFANFFSLTGGRIAPATVFRSASPVDDEYNRASYAEKLMADAGVRFVLNLSDDEAEMDAFQEEAAAKGVDESYYSTLRKEGNVVGVNLGASYPSASYAEKLAAGFVAMSQHDGPYLVHCVEGKDRTGYVCMLLGALAGANYDEMRACYMTTYDNYYGITPESDPVRYTTIVDTNFDCMLEHLLGVEDADEAELRAASYEQPARDYLKMGGMTDDQIDALVARITAR